MGSDQALVGARAVLHNRWICGVGPTVATTTIGIIRDVRSFAQLRRLERHGTATIEASSGPHRILMASRDR